MATAPHDFAPTRDAEAGWGETPSHDHWHQSTIPVVESPSISSNLPDGSAQYEPPSEGANPTTLAEQGEGFTDEPTPHSHRSRLSSLSLGPLARRRTATARYTRPQSSEKASRLQIACVTMGAIALGLVIWRTDIVRLLPQTAAFFKMAGMTVNLRGLAFENVKISTELVDNKPVLIVEGNITGTTKKPIEIPKLRFMVRDANGTEVYAWNAVLDQPVLNPGEKAWFKSRLASPPPQGREIAVRFFNKRDIKSGGI